MSGDWLKIQISTPDKPEVWAIADDLGIDPDAVVGKLIRLWSWFDQHSEKGNAPSVTKALLDRSVCVTGFCDSVIKSGWMCENNGVLSLPNFDWHNGNTGKTRSLAARRAAKHKGETVKQRKSNAPSVTKALPREEKRREDKEEKTPLESKRPTPKKTIFVLPDGVDQQAWDDFEAHRKTTKAKLTDLARSKAANTLSKLSPDDQQACVDYSITGGYPGLYPERLDNQKIGVAQNEQNQRSGRKLSASEIGAENSRRFEEKCRRDREALHGEIVAEDGRNIRT